MWLLQSPKAPILELLLRVNVFTVGSTAEISTAAFSAEYCTKPRQIELEKISFSDMLNLWTGC